MIDIFWWMARRRVAVLAVSLTAAVILQMLRQTAGDGHSLRLNLALGVLPVIPFVLCAAVAARVFHPAKLIARPEIPAFDVPVNPAVVLGAASYTFFAVFLLSGTLHGLVTGPDAAFAAPVVLIIGGSWLRSGGLRWAGTACASLRTANHPEARSAIGSEVAPTNFQVISQTMMPVDQT